MNAEELRTELEAIRDAPESAGPPYSPNRVLAEALLYLLDGDDVRLREVVDAARGALPRLRTSNYFDLERALARLDKSREA